MHCGRGPGFVPKRNTDSNQRHDVFLEELGKSPAVSRHKIRTTAKGVLGTVAIVVSASIGDAGVISDPVPGVSESNSIFAFLPNQSNRQQQGRTPKNNHRHH
jgi:hypothetical protein